MAKVKVYITLKPTLLDAQGTVVQNALNNLGYEEVDSVLLFGSGLLGRRVGSDGTQ